MDAETGKRDEKRVQAVVEVGAASVAWDTTRLDPQGEQMSGADHRSIDDQHCDPLPLYLHACRLTHFLVDGDGNESA